MTKLSDVIDFSNVIVYCTVCGKRMLNTDDGWYCPTGEHVEAHEASIESMGYDSFDCPHCGRRSLAKEDIYCAFCATKVSKDTGK